MSRAAVAESAASIAAEQRAVRANFIFLLGGDVEDEEQEAEAPELLEGRFENRARQEILAATRFMSRAEQELGAVSTTRALPPARSAAQALQRAFGHSRYLLRALPARGRVDPSRRLTGDRTSAADWRRDTLDAAADPIAVAARDAVSELFRVAAALDGGSASPESMATSMGNLAERVLRIDPRAPDIQTASRELLAARQALQERRTGDVRTALDRVLPALLTRAQRGRIEVSGRPRALDRLIGTVTLEKAR
jgi:hypothetical protein